MTTAVGEDIGAGSGYPVHFEVARPEKQSRLTNFPLGIGSLIRSVLAIPHWIILYFLAIAAFVVYFIATFAILFTGRYPRGMFNFYVGYTRWTSYVYGYLLHVYDKYPPFSMDAGSDYPLALTVGYPEKLSRVLNLPLYIGAMIKTVLLIPHFVVLLFLVLVAMLAVFVAQFAILFTGSFPAGIHNFVVGVGRW